MQIEIQPNREIMKSIASKSFALVSAVAVSIGLTTKTAQAGPECDPLVRSANQMVGILTNLKEDFRKHYFHTPKYREIMQDAGDMRKRANHILEIATYRHVPIQHLEADVAALHSLSVQLHGRVDRNEQKRNGHVYGNTKHTHQMLASLTNVVCTMQQQIQALKQPVYHNHGRFSHNTRHQSPVYGGQPVYSQPTYNQPVYGGPVANFAPQTQCNVRQPSNPAYSSHQTPVYNNRGIAALHDTIRYYQRR